MSELSVKAIVTRESCEIKSFLSFPEESSGVTSGVSGSPRIMTQAQNPAQNLEHDLVGALVPNKKKEVPLPSAYQYKTMDQCRTF